MTHRVELAGSIKAELKEAGRYLKDQVSPEAARRWLANLQAAMATLESQPQTCPIATESEAARGEVRELLHGKGRSRHRILFTIEGDRAIILGVRHIPEDEQTP